MDILSVLNPAQREAVKIVDGPVLVLAGPGSGKTRVLTHRVAYLIHEHGIAPHKILAVTFTNKAARAMRERLVQLIGDERVQDLTIGTFHATCARFLRRDGERVGLGRGFVIYDDDDQQSLIKQILKELNLNDKSYRPGAVLGAIGKAKNELIAPEDYIPPSYWHEGIKRAYKRYQELLAENNAADFDDLLMATVRLFRENPDILERYQNRYLYLHVDEFQDTNIAQYVLMKLLADKHQNLFCVGDEDQCLVPDTKVQTPDGVKAIEAICPGESVTVGAGRGHTMPISVKTVHRNKYHGQLIEISTQRGYTIRVTPNHILFARLGLSNDVHYVYLMYRADRGYRIGLVTGSRSDGIHEQLFPGLMIRCHQEHADKVWVLHICHSKSEAQYWELNLAFKYGIPTTLFHGLGRGLRLSEEEIARLFSNLDTRARAAQMMADLQLFPEFPHFRPKAVMRGPVIDRKIINFKLFGDGRRTDASPWSAHRISLNTTDPELKKQLIAAGYHPRPGRRNTWRLESSNLDYDKADDFIRTLAQASGSIEIARSAFFTNTLSAGGQTLSFDFQPAAHIHPTMVVPVFENGKVVDDQVVQVEWKDYDGFVYDLDIPKVHNYIANGIVVHNSIYGWRGADFRNVLRFRDDFPNARVALLEQNYRSTQTIVDVAQAIIRKNRTRHAKTLWTENPPGIPISIYEAYNEEEEAQFVVSEIARLTKRDFRPRDFAVFYRTNAQSRALEDQFVRRGMPYKLVGAIRFYQRREVKDLLAYLRLISNPNDSVSFNRVLNVPTRGIGKRTIDELARQAERLGKSPYAVLEMLREQGSKGERESGRAGEQADSAHPSPFASNAFDARSHKVLLAFANLLDELIAARDSMTLLELFDLILQRTNYEEYVRDGTQEGDDRWENIVELRKAIKPFSTVAAELALSQFLEEVALVADVDTLDENVDAPTLMTLHTAKGLEFPVVFMIGMEEGLFPHSRSFEDPAQMEEERRLCYVGVTRAKERLYLLHAFRRTMYGSSEPGDPSRFLADIPRELLTNTGETRGKPQRGTSSFQTRRSEKWDRDETAEEESDRPSVRRNTSSTSRSSSSRDRVTEKRSAPATEFKAGDKVQHASFGSGVVVSSKVTGADEEVEVAFIGKGVKRLIARYAGLTKGS